MIARWEQGLISPPVESLLEIIYACGFEGAAERTGRVAACRTRPPRARPGRGGDNRGRPGLRSSTRTCRPAVLQRQGVSFVVIGAFARVVYGTRELTDNLDFTLSARKEFLSRLEHALEDSARAPYGKTLDLRKPNRRVARTGNPRRQGQARPQAGWLARLRGPPLAREPRTTRRRDPPQIASPAISPARSATSTMTKTAGKLRRLITLQRSLGRQRKRSQALERTPNHPVADSTNGAPGRRWGAPEPPSRGRIRTPTSRSDRGRSDPALTSRGGTQHPEIPLAPSRWRSATAEIQTFRLSLQQEQLSRSLDSTQAPSRLSRRR